MVGGWFADCAGAGWVRWRLWVGLAGFAVLLL